MVNVLRLWGKNSVKHRFGYRWRVKRYLEATFSMGQMGHILRTNLTNILTMPNTTRMESKHNMVHVFVPMFSMFLQLFTCWYSLVRYLISFLSSVLPNLSLCVCLLVCLPIIGSLVFPMFSWVSSLFCFGKSWLFDKKRHLFSMSSFVSYSFPCVSDCSCTCMGFFPEKEQPDILNSPFQPQFLFVSMQFACCVRFSKLISSVIFPPEIAKSRNRWIAAVQKVIKLQYMHFFW